MSKEAKDKAEELIENFKPHSHFWVHNLGHQKDYNDEQLQNAIQCALICVDEIIKTNPLIDVRITKNNSSWIESISDIDFWNEVKQEILNRQ